MLCSGGSVEGWQKLLPVEGSSRTMTRLQKTCPGFGLVGFWQDPFDELANIYQVTPTCQVEVLGTQC